MIYFLLATGHPTVLRSKYQGALHWFPHTVPLGNSNLESRISDDGRWFALSVSAADAIAWRRLRMDSDAVIAVNGPAPVFQWQGIRRVGLGEIIDVGKATRWALSEEPLRDVVTVKTLLSLAAVCLFLLDEGLSDQDSVK